MGIIFAASRLEKGENMTKTKSVEVVKHSVRMFAAFRESRDSPNSGVTSSDVSNVLKPKVNVHAISHKYPSCPRIFLQDV